MAPRASPEIAKAPIIIAIDGPAGSGKDTIAKDLAATLGLVHVSTGKFYRCIAAIAQKKGIKESDVEALADLAARFSDLIDIRLNPSDPHELRYFLKASPGISAKEKDITKQLEGKGISDLTSRIAGHPPLRESLNLIIRAFALDRGGIFDGRDIATIVLKEEASLKFYLDADVDVRASRRKQQYNDASDAETPPTRPYRGKDGNMVVLSDESFPTGSFRLGLSEVERSEIVARDQRDMKGGALVRPEVAARGDHGYIYIDSTKLTAPETVLKFREHIDPLLKSFLPERFLES